MDILVVGGTGLLGGHAALHLASEGHNVTIGARKPPDDATPLAKLRFLQGDYLDGDDFDVSDLHEFDALVFAAGNDIRHLPQGVDEAAHWQRANVEGVPGFFRRARDAGIGVAVHVGSFYPQAAPESLKKKQLRAWAQGRLRRCPRIELARLPRLQR